MLKGMSLDRKHPPTSLFASYFSLILITNLIEGCAPVVVIETQESETVKGIVEDEAKERLSLPPYP
jgi:hypothetical protein